MEKMILYCTIAVLCFSGAFDKPYFKGGTSAPLNMELKCDTIEVFKIDTLEHHVILKAVIHNNNRNRNVKVIMDKWEYFFDTIHIGQKYCLKLFNYATWYDSEGNEIIVPGFPDCIELDGEKAPICIDRKNYFGIYFFSNNKIEKKKYPNLYGPYWEE